MYIATLQPVIGEVNIASGPVIGKTALYTSDSQGYAILYGGGLLILIGGLWLFYEGTKQ